MQKVSQSGAFSVHKYVLHAAWSSWLHPTRMNLLCESPRGGGCWDAEILGLRDQRTWPAISLDFLPHFARKMELIDGHGRIG